MLTDEEEPSATPGRHRGSARPDDAEQATSSTILNQTGGIAGFAYSTVLVIVFVTANAFLPLPVAIGVAVATGLALFIFRLLRGERFVSAIGSLLGVAVAAGIVLWTGSARDFFVIGIWASLAGFVVTLASVLARRPLTGVVWNVVHGGTHAWRSDRSVRVAHDVATLAAASVFGSRFAIQQWLYLTDSTGGLGIARVVMGTPLTVLAALVSVWAFRRSTGRLIRTNP
ncbi:hypothetical protein PSN13_05166 [Micromonospora saelicesensis]|uniref:DUF3159 domain-containing protein n=1 Tax=Micromonospora saelicesensis TaxID=285676 RepID=A0A328NQ13_9ACTN|nr:DUF3159 domain-containing protein [Micromonospora saelicesensis]RAO29967.1 hypothetical protein PSN13_05166 [Micromonospora saelicesensis]